MANGPDTQTATGGAACTLTYAALPTQSHQIDGITGGLDSDPAAGVAVTVTDGTTVIANYYVSKGGGFAFPGRLKGSLNSQLQIQIAAPGGAVKSAVNAVNKTVTYGDIAPGEPPATS